MGLPLNVVMFLNYCWGDRYVLHVFIKEKREAYVSLFFFFDLVVLLIYTYGVYMLETNYVVNLRNISHWIRDDYLSTLTTYKRCIGFLFGISIMSRNFNGSCVSFNDETIQLLYVNSCDRFKYEDVQTMITNFISSLDGFGRDVFNDLTFYIDVMVESIVDPRFYNYIDVTIDCRHQLNVKSLRVRGKLLI